MKILHTSDWHLGKVVKGFSMLDEQKHFINETFLPAVDENKPDAVIIAGDIFDRRIAGVEAVELFDSVITALISDRSIKTFIIAGNHDGAERLAVYSSVLKKQGLYISARPLDTEPVKIECNDGTMYIHLLPFFDTAIAKDILKRDDLRGQNASMKAILGEMKPFSGAVNILVSHCFAAGGQTSESETQLSVGGSDNVEPSLFEGYDYVALGHLHGPQRVRENVYYSGSPVKYSFDEEHQHKNMLLVSFEGGEKTVTKIPCKPLHDMRTVKGEIDDIINGGKNDEHSEDYIFADLLNKSPVFEPMQKLRAVYPNTMGLNPGWINLFGEAFDTDMVKDLKSGSKDVTIFETFIKEMTGREPTEEELAVFDDMMKKAGV